MSTGIFFVAEHKTLAEALFRDLHERNVPARPYCISSTWNNTSRSEFSYLLSDIVHFVIVPPADPESDAWFSFLMGYATGREVGVTIFRPDGCARLPRLYEQGAEHTDQTALVQTVVDEYTVACHRALVDEARDEIIQRGFGVTDDAFASVVADGDIELVDLFLQLGMSADTTSSSGVPVLNLAVRGGHVPVVERLLEKNVDVNATSDDRGNTALVEAAGRGMTALTRLLVGAGAQPDIETKSGQTALMLAVAEGHLDDASVLLEAGADPDVQDKLGMSARKYAELFNHTTLSLDNVDSQDVASLSYSGHGAE